MAGVLAVQARFLSQGSQPAAYLAFTGILPVLWTVAVALAGGYDARFIGVGSDEFRRLLNAAVSLTAAVAIVSYALKLEVARGYVALAMPSTAVLDLAMRYWLRKHLHRRRSDGQYLRRVVVVGHALAVAELADMLRTRGRRRDLPCRSSSRRAGIEPRPSRSFLTLSQPATSDTEGGTVAGRERERLRQREAESEEWRSMLDAAADGVVLLNADGVILGLDRKAEALFDYDRNKVAGETSPSCSRAKIQVSALEHSTRTPSGRGKAGARGARPRAPGRDKSPPLSIGRLGRPSDAEILPDRAQSQGLEADRARDGRGAREGGARQSGEIGVPGQGQP